MGNGAAHKALCKGLIIFLSLATMGLADAAGEPPREWKKVTDKNGIKVYMSHSDESRLKTFRGVTRLTAPDIRVVIAMLEDEETLPEWMHMISKIRLVRMLEGADRQFHIETSLPWPVKDRDTYVDMHVIQHGDYSISIDVEQSENPPPPEKGYVRMPEIKGYVSMKVIPGSSEVDLSYEMVLNPGGYIPAWLLNLILADVPYFTLMRFRRVIETERYKGYETDVVKRRPWVEEAEDNSGN